MATKIKHLKVGGTTYDIAATTADSMGEANLTWGGKNFSGSFGPMDAALNPVLSANRLAGMDPAGITVEYSTNGGSTWTTYPLSDAQKLAIVTTSTGVRIGGPSASQTANSQVRVTLDGVSGGVYTQLNKLQIYVSTNYSNGCTVTLESYDYNSSTSWHTILTNNISGWSGWNVLNFSLPGTGCFGGENANQHQRKIRLTFKHTGITSGQESNGLWINKIYGYGGVGWSTNSDLAANGTPYSYDEYLNVTFPKQVTATKFNGNATGLVDAGNGSPITANYSASGMPYSSVSWLAAWNGYSLQSISKDEFVGNNADSVSTALNKLNSGNATPSGTDYYICQSAGGGTTDTTYYRRPVSALWNYIKGQADNVYVAKGTIATTSAAGLMSSDDKSKLDGIAAGANNYSLPNASSSTLGGVKIGDNITCSLGTISLTKANVTTALGYTPPVYNLVVGRSNSSWNETVNTNGQVYVKLYDTKTNSYDSYKNLNVVGTDGITVTSQSGTSGTLYIGGGYYHSTGTWNGLTYTATSENSAPKLSFTLPTGTTSTTVALGNHTHSNFDNDVQIGSSYCLDVRSIKTYSSMWGSSVSTGSSGQVLKCGSSGRLYWGYDSTGTDYKASSSNSSETLYLVGVTAQSTSATEGKQTYSNSLCYASGGYLYSNGKKVDMDSISGGVEWGTF